MRSEDRKAVTAAYKERKAVAGIYALHCDPSGQRWVGRAMDLGTVQNRLWFMLRQGLDRSRSLQAAWTRHGPQSFTFEEVERLDDETLAYVRDKLLKERLAHWCAALAAEAI